MPASYYPVHYEGHPSTDWNPRPPSVTCPECGKTNVPLVRIMDGEHEDEWTIRTHQSPGDGHGCTPRIVYDVDATPRPYYREHGGEH